MEGTTNPTVSNTPLQTTETTLEQRPAPAIAIPVASAKINVKAVASNHTGLVNDLAKVLEEAVRHPRATNQFRNFKLCQALSQFLHILDLLDVDSNLRLQINKKCTRLLEQAPKIVHGGMTGYDAVREIKCEKKPVTCVTQTQMNTGEQQVLSIMKMLLEQLKETDRHLPPAMRPVRSRGGMIDWVSRGYGTIIDTLWKNLDSSLQYLSEEYAKRIDHIECGILVRLLENGVSQDDYLRIGDDKFRKRNREMLDNYGPPMKALRYATEPTEPTESVEMCNATMY